MAVENDVWQDFFSSILSDSKEGNLSDDVLSPEDVAWIDSCLVNDPELTDNSWNAFKDALLDIVISQPTLHYEASASGTEVLPRGAYDDVVPMSEEAEAVEFPVRTDNIHFSTIEKVEAALYLGETDDESVPISEKTGSAQFQSYFRNCVLYEFRRQEENEDNEVKVDLWPMNEIEASPKNIFRVWDFDTPAEEYELDQQLRKALAEGSIETAPLTIDNSLIALDNESLDDLIAGIADLSLHPSYS